jgi:putative oxidoreductase
MANSVNSAAALISRAAAAYSRPGGHGARAGKEIVMTTTTIDAPSKDTHRAERPRLARLLLATTPDGAATVARLVLALVMFPHAVQHSTGGFGGFGYAGMMKYFASLKIPAPFGFAAIAAEVLAPLALALGIAGRVAAASIAAVMAVAVATVHLPNGFFMNWLGNHRGEGFEYHLLAIALAAVVMIRGSGRWSIDRWWTDRGARDLAASARSAGVRLF